MVRKTFTWISVILMIIASLNWMSIGIFNFNFVEWIVGGSNVIATIIYIVVGVASLWMIVYLSTMGAVNERKNVTGSNSGERHETYGHHNQRDAHNQRRDKRENYNRYSNKDNSNYRNY
ncbi:MAG: DUF378 domain-containing protein [Clostridia bacterium]